MVNYFEENLRTAASVLLIIKLISIGYLLTFPSVWDIWWDGFYEEHVCRSVKSMFFIHYQ